MHLKRWGWNDKEDIVVEKEEFIIKKDMENKEIFIIYWYIYIDIFIQCIQYCVTKSLQEGLILIMSGSIQV